MLAVDAKYQAWEEPSSYNSHLSALIYCSQLWVFRFSCDWVDSQQRARTRQEEGDDGLDEQLDTIYGTTSATRSASRWRTSYFGGEGCSVSHQ